AGPAADAALGPWFANLPASAHAKTDADADAGTLIRLPAADDKPRYLWIAPIDVAEQAWPELVKTLTPRAAGAWRLDDIRAGGQRLRQPMQEECVQQMFDFDLVGGVNIQMGCYPGRELVACSQYRGELSRRLVRALVSTDDTVAAGQEVYSSSVPQKPCG